jgi:para-aminobenzoate synthetase component 1
MSAASHGHALPLVEPGPSLAPIEAFLRLHGLPRLIFFDSAMRDPRLGRYSYLAADPFAGFERPAAPADPLADVAEALQRFAAPTVPGIPPFQGGLAGLLGYELGGAFETLPPPRADDLPTPPLALGAYDVVLSYDHHRDECWIISQGFPEIDPQARRERATARLDQMRAWLARPPQDVSAVAAAAYPALPLDKLASQFDVGIPGVTSNLSAEEYRAMVRRGVDYIHAGDVFQVNLAQRLVAPAHDSAAALYLRLRERNPAPYAGYFDLGAAQVASASPECFLTVRDGHVETRPIKGTRGRSRTPEADLFAGDELQESEKDRAENVMIVDLMRNDLSRGCTPDSVKVSQLCRLETYAFVQHLVSVVEGQLRPGLTPVDLLRATFPGGSITGAPKVRAMEIIAELEPTARGPYCGSLAYLGFDGSMDANILIRTITTAHGWRQLPVGGGIVSQSDPDAEYQETWHKARGLLNALR